MKLLLTLALALLAHAGPEKEIFVPCNGGSLASTFGDDFTREEGTTAHPVSGEEVSLLGFKNIGNRLVDDTIGTTAHFRERRRGHEVWNSADGKYRVYCGDGRVSAVAFNWPGDLTGFHQAMVEKYAWNLSRPQFASAVEKHLAKGLVYIVKKDKERVITTKITEVDGKTRVRVFYYRAPRLDDEILYLNRYEEEKKKASEEKLRKAKDGLL